MAHFYFDGIWQQRQERRIKLMSKNVCSKITLNTKEIHLALYVL